METFEDSFYEWMANEFFLKANFVENIMVLKNQQNHRRPIIFMIFVCDINYFQNSRGPTKGVSKKLLQT